MPGSEPGALPLGDAPIFFAFKFHHFYSLAYYSPTAMGRSFIWVVYNTKNLVRTTIWSRVIKLLPHFSDWAFFPLKCINSCGGKNIQTILLLAGVVGFEPTECRSQSPVPYRLAIPQYLQDTIFVASPIKLFSKFLAGKTGLEPAIHKSVICCMCLSLSYINIISYFFKKIKFFFFTRHA